MVSFHPVGSQSWIQNLLHKKQFQASKEKHKIAFFIRQEKHVKKSWSFQKSTYNYHVFG